MIFFRPAGHEPAAGVFQYRRSDQWFLDPFSSRKPPTTTTNVPMAFAIRGRLDAAVMESSLN